MGDDCIRRLRESSRNVESHDELTELEAELRNAYVAKELRAQILEQETERYIEGVRRQQASKLARLREQADLELEVRQKCRSLQESGEYRRQLEEQIARKQEEAAATREEERREREILAEVDRLREHSEAMEAQRTKEELSESARRERLILEEMKAIRRSEEMEAELRERLRDRRYLEDVEQRATKAMEVREQQRRRRELAMQEIAGLLVSMQAREKEKETLIAELLAEDVKLEMLAREEEDAARRRRWKEELAAGLEEQIAFAEQCKLRAAEVDRAFAAEMMKRVMEDEKTARLTAEARRRMQSQYREDLDRLVETRRRIREEEVLRMEEAAREEKRQLEMDLERVREERRRLLEKHAANVAEFIDKGVLTAEERRLVEECQYAGN